MVDMYAKVNKDRKIKKDSKFNYIISAVIVIMMFVVLSFAWAFGYHFRFHSFVSGLSNSTTYAYNNDTLIAEIDGKSMKISGENMYGIYSYISITGSGKERKTPPDGEPIILSYGDGSVLKLWDEAGKDNPGRHNLFLQYTNIDGEIYSYLSYGMTLDTIVTRYLLYDNIEIAELTD